MRKSLVILVIAGAVAVPGAALAAKPVKAVKPLVVNTTPANQNDLSRKVVADAVRQIFVPLEVTLARK